MAKPLQSRYSSKTVNVKAVQLGIYSRIVFSRIWQSQFCGSYGIKLSWLGCELCSMWIFLVRAYPYADQGELPNSDKQPRFRGSVNDVGNPSKRGRRSIPIPRSPFTFQTSVFRKCRSRLVWIPFGAGEGQLLGLRKFKIAGWGIEPG